jgi:hypothetical protein
MKKSRVPNMDRQEAKVLKRYLAWHRKIALPKELCTVCSDNCGCKGES